MLKSLLLSTLMVLSLPSLSLAQHRLCGSPPEFKSTSEEIENLKGELQGKAQILSRFVGDAGLSGKVENERKSIYQSADKVSAAQQDAYLSYIFCVLIMDDNKLSTQEKLKAVNEFKKPTPELKDKPIPSMDQPTPQPSISTPKSVDVLYETGEFENWSLTRGWGRVSSMLLYDGTERDFQIAPIFAPYTPQAADYAVEAEIRVIEDFRGSFGVVVRANGKQGYAVGIGTKSGSTSDEPGIQVTNICYLDGWFNLDGLLYPRGCKLEKQALQTIEPSRDYRTYRIEVKGNVISFLIDEVVMIRVTDNKFLSAGRVGLWADGFQLEVRNFKVIKLKPR
jgi:hypothetical protein